MAHLIRSSSHRLLHQLYVLASEELRELTLRRRSLLSLALYVGVVSLVVLGLAYVENRLSPTMGIFRLDNEETTRLIKNADQYGLQDEMQLIQRLGRWPSPVVILQLFSLLWFPTLIALVSCDMVAIDIYRGTLRYIILRTSRTVYYFSKLLAHFFLYVILQLLSLLALLIACALRVPEFHLSTYLQPMAIYFIIILPFLWFTVATTQFISCWSNRPMNAIVRLHLLWMLFFMMLYFVPWASPMWSEFSIGLVIPFEGYGLRSMMGMIAWALLFTLGGLVLFRRRMV